MPSNVLGCKRRKPQALAGAEAFIVHQPIVVGDDMYSILANIDTVNKAVPNDTRK